MALFDKKRFYIVMLLTTFLDLVTSQRSLLVVMMTLAAALNLLLGGVDAGAAGLTAPILARRLNASASHSYKNKGSYS
mgnify:FL=1